MAFDLSRQKVYDDFIMDPTVIALVGTIFGGVGLKVAEHYLTRNKVRTDDATQIRDELRLEITSLREELKATEEERDKYRNEYYLAVEKAIAQQQQFHEQLNTMKQQIIDEIEAAKELPANLELEENNPVQ